MFKRLLLLCALLIGGIWFAPSILYAAPYGSDSYGKCVYQEGCPPPVVVPPTQPPVVTPDSVSRNVDDDDNLETATDTNGEAGDGFETFGDTDSSSTVLKTLDGDEDDKTDFIINTDNDPLPEKYWDPDDDILSTIQLVQCDLDDGPEWRFNNGTEVITYDDESGELLEDCEITPTVPSNANGNPRAGSGGAQVKETRITNVVPFLAENPVYESIGRAVKKVPAPVAYSFPYLLLLVILLLVVRLIIQSRQEVNRLVVATRAQEAEKQLTLEKENFMMLSSHYLRTPITVINGSIELMQSLKQITEEVAKTLNGAGKLLMGEVTSLLDRLEQDKKLAMIQKPSPQTRITTFISPRLVLPVILIVAVLLLGQFLLIDFRVVSPNIVNMLIQIALAVLLIQTFLSKIRQRQLNRHNRQDQERVLEEQRALDAARSEFINNVANNLETQLNQFKAQLGNVIDKPEAAKVKRALSELATIISKFRLVAYLQGGQLRSNNTVFAMSEVIDASIKPYMEQAKAKAVTFNNTIIDERLYQQQQLLSIVLGSLVENAVKFSGENSTVDISAKNNDGQAIFTITDHGKGIPQDKQELLFKPFSRTESAEQFNTEGLGFSLYLDKVITNYLQGQIEVFSREGQGTTVTVTVPAAS